MFPLQSSIVVECEYDSNGMHMRKTYKSMSRYIWATNNYMYNGKLVYLDLNGDNMHFYYDGQGRPAIVNYNGSYYHYLYNLQGDVIGLVDTSGSLVVEYKYNAWGSILGRTGSMVNTLGALNPFRYRGYVYDDETAMCYCRSRYYYPELHRFISADTMLGEFGVLFSHNAYIYCANKVVVSSDKTGHTYAVVALIDSFVNIAIETAKDIISAVGAELQLIFNRARAKQVLHNIGETQMEYLTNYPYGGAENAAFTGIYDRYSWFYNQVNHKAPMDYKRIYRRPWWLFGRDTVFFKGKEITIEEYGNINYGYVGKALGIPDWIIYAGGGFAAVSGGGDKSWNPTYFFDSEDDHNNIAWGIELYRNTWGNE